MNINKYIVGCSVYSVSFAVLAYVPLALPAGSETPPAVTFGNNATAVLSLLWLPLQFGFTHNPLRRRGGAPAPTRVCWTLTGRVHGCYPRVVAPAQGVQLP